MDIGRLKKILEYSRTNHDEIYSMVRKFFSFAGLDSDNDVLNILQIVRSSFRKKGYLVIEMPLHDQEIGALSYKGEGIGYVVVNTSLPRVNVNFALAHEVYHVFFQTSKFISKVEFANDNYYEHEEEFAANLFAGMLLMPEVGFRKMFRTFLEESDGNETDTLVRLMTYYEVPYMAVLIRCCELQLLSTNPVSKLLLNISPEEISGRIKELWLNEDVLNPTNKNDYDHLESVVQRFGKEFIAKNYINERTLTKVLKNMRSIYAEIKGDI